MDMKAYSETAMSKKPALELLQKLGYTYISKEDCGLQRGGYNNVLLTGILRTQLRRLNHFTFGGVEQEFSSANIEKAIKDLDEPMTDGLIKTSEKIYNALMLGKSYQETVGAGKVMSFNLKYIDWDNWSNNVFHVAEEFRVAGFEGAHDAQPDIVLFINGIPFAVIECKAPDVKVEKAVEQHLRNQNKSAGYYIPQLYKFAQVLMATNKNTVMYGTAGTPKEFWTQWKEEDREFLRQKTAENIADRTATVQDENIISLLAPERLMELTKHYIIYDGRQKKICRYQQYFAVREIIRTINKRDKTGNRESGVIWHTQGSGKSLTMVMLAKYILTQLDGTQLDDVSPRVIIVTDRKELDRQIARTFTHTRLKPARATSGKNLIELINSGKADVITTIINKFNTVESSGLKSMEQDIFVLVDESHRSNYGELAAKMRVVFPNACYIGFTGTPLMKREKNTMKRFGKLIHKYDIQSGVEDKAIVPLIYEGRFVEQDVDEANIDLWFEQTTKRLTDSQKTDLKRRWSSIKRLTSTESRIRRIALDINNHFLEGYKNTGFKAMLATNRKRDAVSYLECFRQLGDLTCEVCISAPDMREGTTGIDESADDKVIDYWNKAMERYGNADDYEESVKMRFIDGKIDILIVCNKLLTGFDAPLCQVMYLDKELKEHGLLQAIARANRVHEGKDYGLIVDYRGLIERLDEAVSMYSGAGLENFDAADLKGTVNDIVGVIGNLRQAYSNLDGLFDSVQNKEDAEEIEIALADEGKRQKFYRLLCEFGKALAIILNSETFYQNLPQEERKAYQDAFGFYSKVRRSVKLRYSDMLDNSEYEPLMQNLLDTHLSVKGLKQITAPVDIFSKTEFEKELASLGSSRARADAIQSRLTKSISEKYYENPAYYDSFSKRIKETLQQYRDKIITEAERLEKLQTILNDYQQGSSHMTFPQILKDNLHAQAYYGVVGAILSDELEAHNHAKSMEEEHPYAVSSAGGAEELLAEIALDISKIIQREVRVDWENNQDVHNKIAQEIDDLFYRYSLEGKVRIGLDVVDKIIENVKTTALRRYKP